MSQFRRASWSYLLASVALVAVLAAVLVGARNHYSSPVAEAHATEVGVQRASDSVRVETVSPTKGGLKRHSSQPGTAHSFESADLYAKVSGFLKVQHVDIGSRVKKGERLVEIDVPELLKDVEAATASHQQTLAELAQAEARVESAIADQKAAQSRVAQAKADGERHVAQVQFSQKQFDRIKELNDLKGVEDRLVDEKQFQLQSSQADERAAQSAVLAFEQQAIAAQSRVNLAKADLEVAKAKSRVAESQLERAKVMAAYTQIVSPYDGVVTARNFHPGAFVRSPEQGGQVPLLSVDRTDLIRVKVRIPEREILFIQPGDQVTIRFDALPGKGFSAPVARIAESEDSATRTMLAEIDLPNPERMIRDHMYGRVEIMLDEALEGVTIPSACLVGDASAGQGQVYVVENGKAKLRKVQLGRDTGIQVEVLTGLNMNDSVILRPTGGLADGAEVVSSHIATPVPAIAHK